MNDSYKTKQKDLIMNEIIKQNHEFTIKDIYEKLSNEVGLTTIYRLVDRLVKEGILNKTISKENITYYQYLERCNHKNHFYLKCEKCGSMIHVDCDCIEELTNHILNNHKFKLTREHIIINGVCKNCAKEV